MLFRRKSFGIEISPHGVSVVELSRSDALPILVRHGRVPFPHEVVRVSLREPNVADAGLFVATVRETVNLVDHSMKRVSLSLPDASGRVFLLEMETPYKSRDEALDLIRWKLKKSFPIPIQDVHVDFQPMERKVSGELVLLVSCIAQGVIRQYEDLLVDAGLEPYQIDFTAFNLYHLFVRSFRMGDRRAYVFWSGSTLSLFIFSAGVLVFHRSKEIPLSHFDSNRIFRELSSSLIAYKGKSGGGGLQEVYCFSTFEDREAMEVIVRDATESDPVMLDPGKVIQPGVERPDPLTLSLLSPAIGAACRVL
ncbi:MAG: pilus assembly protein PilM [Desulfuromonadia bacterium]